MRALLVICALMVLWVAMVEGKRKIDFPGCRYQRQDAIDCGERYVDLNHDHDITIDEVREARKWLNWWETFFSWFAESPEQSMRNCGATPEGRITPADFEAHKDTCMNSCFKVESAIERVCNRAAAAVGDPPWPISSSDTN